MFVSLSMSFIFLLQGVAMDMDLCEQVEEISKFISHYEDHKDSNGDSFLEYVVGDYLNDNKDEHHKGSDQEKIPSHSHNQCCHPVVFAPTPLNSVAIKSIGFEINAEFDNSTFHFNSRYLESLFQPPRA